MSPVGRLVFKTSEVLIRCLVGSTPTSSANRVTKSMSYRELVIESILWYILFSGLLRSVLRGVTWLLYGIVIVCFRLRLCENSLFGIIPAGS